MITYCKAKDKNNCTLIFYSSSSICFHRHVKILKLLCVLTGIEQIKKYTTDKWEPGVYLLKKEIANK